jgi:hypothetical protein
MKAEHSSVRNKWFTSAARYSCIAVALVLGCGEGGKSEPTGAGGSAGNGNGSSSSGSSSGSGGEGSGGSGGGGSSDSRCLPAKYDAPAVFVSSTGDDANAGTKDAPVRTFAQAFEIRTPGQDVRVLGGTYTEKLLVSKGGTADSPLRVLPVAGEKVILDATGMAAGKPIDITGNYVHVQGFEAKGSGNQCVDITGNDVVLCQVDAHDCESHGIQIGSQRVWVEGNTIHNAVLENEGAPAGQGWGSGLKVKVGGEDVTLYRNRMYHNWGEGLAVTRGKNVVVRENLSYDNFSVNFYIDNSFDVLVEKNMATCVMNSGFERDGKPANAFMIGEEYYDGWGAQLHAVTIRNNIGIYCSYGFLFAGSDVGGGLVDVSIVHNTFWGGVSTAISIGAGVTQGTVVRNNIAQQPDGKDVWIESLDGIDVGTNLWVDGVPADWTNGSAAGDVVGDPMFVAKPDYKAASYRFSETSPARDKALLSASPVDDFEGRMRSVSGSEGTDMGAMEYGDPSLPCAFDALWK